MNVQYIRPIRHGIELKEYKDNRKFRVFFNKGIVCATCGIIGNVVIKYKDINNANHLDLYHFGTKGKVLMTVDHIIPKSKGGNNKLKNLQCMCSKCNEQKADKMEEINYDKRND
jgi:5-methylcytosine-specific restriction endonuclease McrA